MHSLRRNLAILVVALAWTNNSFCFQETTATSRLHERARVKIVLRSSSSMDSPSPADSFKKQLLQLGASYDSGFGASPSARKEALRVIDSLEALNLETDAARGIAGDAMSPLEGSWRLIWTNAQDVLVLAASPLSTVGAIYQVFDPPTVTNIIDLLPRAQALLPPSLLPQSLIRAEVTTRASPRRDKLNRVGLEFEAVKLKPVEVLGFEAGNLPSFAFGIPKIPGVDPEMSPGYFDVTFLDSEILIIRQNSPGGLFALVKVNCNDP